MSKMFSPFGVDLFGEAITKAAGPVAAKFTIPPFTVLDARSGEWQDRKAAWMSLGIRGEVGRDSPVIHCPTTSSPELVDADYVSIFDPVLCKLMYRWFCPDGGQVVDPFAGGSVRGVVASLLGLNYWGCDLRSEQVLENVRQGGLLCHRPPMWVCGDALDVLGSAPPADLVFTCPPYGDLEVYSDDPRDLSAMEYHAFIGALKRVALRCERLLKSGGYFAVVVGDFRDKRTGHYRGFVADTIHAFRECGLALYNDAVLVTSIGSLSMRVTKQFEASRKMGKAHQNVLVFKKIRQV